jgi:hypothetical protein
MPYLAREERRQREHPLFDDYEPARGDPMLDRGQAETKVKELPPGDTIELAAGELRDLSVPHTPI